MGQDSESMAAPGLPSAGTRGRWIAFKVLTGVFAAASAGALFGAAIVIAWLDNSDGGIHRVHNMGYGALYGAILTTGFFVQNWRPERKISAFYQILDVGIATILAGVLATSGFALVGVFILVAYAIVFALHPYRSELLQPQREGFSPVLMVLTIAGGIPLIWYALATAKLQRNGLVVDPHVKMDHWTTMAAMAIGIVLVAFLSAFKFRGWLISARSAAAAIFLFGLISSFYPLRAGSEGRGWGLAAVAGGVVFAAAAQWEAARAPASA